MYFSMEYLAGDKRFSFSYKELKEKYLEYVDYTDEMFLANIKEILHFVAFVSYLKEIDSKSLLADDGLIHELVHLLNDVETVENLEDIRNNFKELMKLS